MTAHEALTHIAWCNGLSGDFSGVVAPSGQSDEWTDEEADRYNRACAQSILDALTAAGYAVIELPKPEETVDGPQWPVSQHWGGGNPDRDGYVTIRRSDGRITALCIGNPHDCPADARALAAALLAAADAAEAS